MEGKTGKPPGMSYVPRSKEDYVRETIFRQTKTRALETREILQPLKMQL